jgi:hypothetical protein
MIIITVISITTVMIATAGYDYIIAARIASDHAT